MRWSVRWAVSLGLALAVVSGAGCASSPTQLIVVVDTDLAIPAQLDDVSIQVSAASQGVMASQHQSLTNTGLLPLTLAVIPNGDFLGPIDVTAVGSHGGTTVVSRQARVTLVRGETRMLRLDLAASCVGTMCSSGQSCGPMGCVAIEVPQLPTWPGGPTRVFDGGPVDSGTMDMGASEGGPVDGGADAPMVDAWLGCTTPAECDDGVACTVDDCMANHCTHVPMDSMCSDGEVCTDDHCDVAMGCMHPANSAACDDGMFCNGFDSCAGGTCAMHVGDPCAAPTVCDEATDRCRGCVTTADCPGASTGAWGSCSYADGCAQTGSQTRTTRSYTCTAGACVPTDGMETGPCSRSTDGMSCGTGSCGAYGACDYTDTCDQAAVQSRTCTDLVCTSGSCHSSMRSDTLPCSRSTNGTMCMATSCGAFGACSYSDVCDQSATQSRTCMDFTCSSGACGGTPRTDTQMCTRSTNGTSCGPTSCGAWGSCGYADVCDQNATQSRSCNDQACSGGICTGSMHTEMQGCSRSTDGTSCGASMSCMGGSCASCIPTLSGSFGTGSSSLRAASASGGTITFTDNAGTPAMGSVMASGATFAGSGSLPSCIYSVSGLGDHLHFVDMNGTNAFDVTVTGATVSGSYTPDCLDIGPYGCVPVCIFGVMGAGNSLTFSSITGSGVITFGC